jgi:hypothetical protein
MFQTYIAAVVGHTGQKTVHICHYHGVDIDRVVWVVCCWPDILWGFNLSAHLQAQFHSQPEDRLDPSI